MHESYPTPWRVVCRTEKLVWYIMDANDEILFRIYGGEDSEIDIQRCALATRIVDAVNAQEPAVRPDYETPIMLGRKP